VKADEAAYEEGNEIELVVTVTRECDEEDLPLFAGPVIAPYYPKEKEEQWWLIVGQPKENRLLSIKKVGATVKGKQQTT